MGLFNFFGCKNLMPIARAFSVLRDHKLTGEQLKVAVQYLDRHYGGWQDFLKIEEVAMRKAFEEINGSGHISQSSKDTIMVTLGSYADALNAYSDRQIWTAKIVAEKFVKNYATPFMYRTVFEDWLVLSK
jgi:hypothetical protein